MTEEANQTAEDAGSLRLARALFIALLTAIAMLWCPVAARAAQPMATIVLRLDSPVVAIFCYDRVPELVYLQDNRAKNTTAIKARSLDGNVRTIAEVSGVGDSLSCSRDGSTIAVLDASETRLYIIQSSEVSTYSFDRSLLRGQHGRFSLLSPDGSKLSAPGMPMHVAGPDILKRMRFLKTETYQTAFFDEENVYVAVGGEIDLYGYADDGWQLKREMVLEQPGSANEISRCGSHLVASVSDDVRSRFLTLEDRLPERAEWLRKMGVTSLLRRYSDRVTIAGAFGRCALPLRAKSYFGHFLWGIATFDDEGLQTFAMPAPVLAMAGEEIELSKDGCYAWLSAFKPGPVIPHSATEQGVLVRLPARGCKF